MRTYESLYKTLEDLINKDDSWSITREAHDEAIWSLKRLERLKFPPPLLMPHGGDAVTLIWEEFEPSVMEVSKGVCLFFTGGPNVDEGKDTVYRTTMVIRDHK